MDNYTFEYQFLPRVVRHYHRGFNISQLFAEPLNMLKNVFLNIYAAHDDQVYDWEELSFKHQQGDDYEQLLITFPTPVQEPEAHYGLIVKYQNKRPAYFTLEKGDDEQSQFICMPDIRQHSLLKSTEGIRTAEEFAKQVHQLIAQNSRLLKDEHVNAR